MHFLNYAIQRRRDCRRAVNQRTRQSQTALRIGARRLAIQIDVAISNTSQHFASHYPARGAMALINRLDDDDRRLFAGTRMRGDG